MRHALVVIVFAFTIATMRAQEQERQLVDRLLKPDTTLQNNAQEKNFTAKTNTTQKQASVKSFYISQQPATKQFAEHREYSVTQFAANHFRDGELSSTMQARAERVRTFSVPDGAGATAVRDISDSGKKVASTQYPNERTFLDKGKSQQALNQRNAPLTIEQVRELLNKNK